MYGGGYSGYGGLTSSYGGLGSTTGMGSFNRGYGIHQIMKAIMDEIISIILTP